MMALTIADIVQKIAEFTGLPSLVVEVGFLLFMTAFIQGAFALFKPLGKEVKVFNGGSYRGAAQKALKVNRSVPWYVTENRNN
jgi:hypothetical protein